jgi:dTDP-glucose 4,6-dehydratase
MSRCTNNYGPRQHPEKLVGRVITSLLKGEKIPVHAKGKPVRNWIHVEDCVNACLTILDWGEINNVYNISSDEEFSVKETIEFICKFFNVNYKDVIDENANRSGVDYRYALDSSKLKKLGWVQNRNFESSIEELVEYYKENAEH